MIGLQRVFVVTKVTTNEIEISRIHSVTSINSNFSKAF